MARRTSPDILSAVDDLLLDSSHPLDEKQARRLQLELLRAIFRDQETIRDDQIAMRNDLLHMQRAVEERRTALDQAMQDIKRDVNELWKSFREYPSPDEVKEFQRMSQEYPSLTWLLRYRTRATLTTLAIALAIFIALFLTYNEWLFNRLNLPPLIQPLPAPYVVPTPVDPL